MKQIVSSIYSLYFTYHKPQWLNDVCESLKLVEQQKCLQFTQIIPSNLVKIPKIAQKGSYGQCNSIRKEQGITRKFLLEKLFILYFNLKDWARNLKSKSIFIFEDEKEKYLKLLLFRNSFVCLTGASEMSFFSLSSRNKSENQHFMEINMEALYMP